MAEANAQQRAVASLYNLLSELKRYIQIHRATFYYMPEAAAFLDAMLVAVRHTQDYLRHLQSKPDDKLANEFTNVGNLSEQWSTLHRFVKPVADADLLHIPVPLVELLNRQCAKLPGVDKSRAVVCHGPSFGYFKREHASIRQAIDIMASAFIGAGINAPTFPKSLGIIVLPFTSTKQLFQNTILYHELGEFIYDEGLVGAELRYQLYALGSESSETSEAYSRMNEPEKEQVISWCRELFCDLFSVYIIGPVFAFASADYCELANDRHEQWLGSHPPDDVRMGEQISVLKELAWWDFLEQKYPDTCRNLNDLFRGRNNNLKEWEEAELQRSPTTAKSTAAQTPRFKDLSLVFNYLKDTVRTLARNRTDGVRIPQPSSDVWDSVVDCLAHGIVPSAVLARKAIPALSAELILNAGYFFAREHIDEVLKITPDRASKNVADRAWIESRVEEWTLKAIDDVLNWKGKRPKLGSTLRANILEPTGGVIPWRPIVKSWRNAKPSGLDIAVVTPFDWRGLDEDSIDLRLGPRFVLSRPHKIASMDFGRKDAKKDPLELLRSQELMHIPKGQDIIIPPHGTILGVTLEFIKLPYNASGQVLTKSSLARRFVTIETAPWIHPLYRGCLTLEIANSSGVAVRLRVGEPIAQLVLFSLANAERPERDRIDKYAGPTYPELDPASDP